MDSNWILTALVIFFEKLNMDNFDRIVPTFKKPK